MQIQVKQSLELYDGAGTVEHDGQPVILPVREAQALMGETVAAYLARVEWHFDLPTICVINAQCYGRAEWSTRTLGLNDNVQFVSRPMGGGGGGGSTLKSIASVVALIALTAVAPQLGALGAGALLGLGGAATGTLATVLSAAIVGAGALAISYFLSPKPGGKTKETDPLYSFGLQGNQSKPMQPIPVLNGRLKFGPEYAAPTYSEYDGDGMVDYALFALTCGRMQVEKVFIGDTELWDKDAGYSPDYPGVTIEIVEPGNQVTLYPVNVVSAEELQGVELTTTYSQPFIPAPAGTSTIRVLIDLVWPGGAYHTSEKGKLIKADTHVVLRARPIDDAGAPTGTWAEVFSKVYSNAKNSQIRITEHITWPGGRWEFAMKRFNEPTKEDNGTDAVTWAAIRAHIDGPQSFPRVTTMAVKGVASKQLSGVNGGQLKVLGTRILPVWESGQFVDRPTRSIAWAALDWWRNGDYAAGLSLVDVDFSTFINLDALWAALGHTFDARFTEVQNLDEVLETVLKAGRAFPAPVGDKLTVIRDQPRGLSRMLFTENDIVAGSLEIDYALSEEQWADGMVGEYVDERTWRLAEVNSAPDGVQLLKPARVKLEGIVNRVQATGVIRFMAAESQYRRVNVSWTARSEGRLLKRGDLVRISADEPESWGQSREIVEVRNGGFTLRLDPAPVWEDGVNHYIELRRTDGRPWGPVRVTRGDTPDVCIVSSPDAASVAAQQGVALGVAVSRRVTQERPWAVFSPGNPRSFPVLITEGTPDQDNEHIQLKGVLDAPEVYTTTESGVPLLPIIADLYSGSLPAIIGLVANISQRQATLILSAGWQGSKNAATYEAAVTYDGGTTWIEAYRGDRTVFEAVVGASPTMRVRVRGLSPSGVPGAWYVTDVSAPDLSIDGDLFKDLSIRIEKLSAQTQKEINDISDLGRGLLALDQETGNIGIDLAHDTIRGGMRQLAELINRMGEAAATQTESTYAQHTLVKIGNSANYAAIERNEEARLTDKEAFAEITTGLSVRLTTAEGGIVGNATAIQGLSTFVTDIDGRVTAQSQSITALSSRIDANDLSLAGQATAVQSLVTRVTVTEGDIVSISQQITALYSSISDTNGNVLANAQAISTLSAETTSIDGRVSAQATYLQALNTTLDGHTATLTTYGSSIDGVKVQYGVTGYIDGQTGGFVFTGVRQLDGSVSFSLNIRADVFVDGTITARKLAATEIIVGSAQIGDLVVSTRAIGYRQVTNLLAAVSGSMDAAVTITPRDGSYVVIMAQAVNGPNTELPDNTVPGSLYILKNGDLNQQINSIPNNATYTGSGSSRRTRIFSQTILGFDFNPTPGVAVTYNVVNSAGYSLPGIIMTVQEFAR